MSNQVQELQELEEAQRLDRRKDMKIAALRERIAELTVAYEDRDADRRIALTEANQLIEHLSTQLAANAENDSPEVNTDDEVE